MFMLDADNVSDTIRQSDNTIRVDPLDHFRKYRGGFNITNKHYWSVNLSTFLFFMIAICKINDVVNLSLTFL